MKRVHNLLKKLEGWDGNNFYGIGNILKRYAGLPGFIPLNFRMQHGISFWNRYTSFDKSLDFVNFYKLHKKKGNMFLIFNEDYLPCFHKENIYNVKAIGAPLIYMDDFIKKVKTRVNKRSGTIVFPHHSTHHFRPSTDFDNYAKQLTVLPKKFHPIKICMYYLDIEKGYDKPFKEKGFEILCNGRLDSQNFLYNFINNIITFEYATSNCKSGSAGYYSVYLGGKFFSYGPSFKSVPVTKYGECHQGRDFINYCPDDSYSFPIENVDDYEHQRKIVNRELGIRSKLSKKEMRKMILGAINRQFLKMMVKIYTGPFYAGCD